MRYFRTSVCAPRDYQIAGPLAAKEQRVLQRDSPQCFRRMGKVKWRSNISRRKYAFVRRAQTVINDYSFIVVSHACRFQIQPFDVGYAPRRQQNRISHNGFFLLAAIEDQYLPNSRLLSALDFCAQNKVDPLTPEFLLQQGSHVRLFLWKQ